MKLLLDTNVLLWTLFTPGRLSETARSIIASEDNEIVFSIVSIWEIAIKCSLRREDFTARPDVVAKQARMDGFVELPLTVEDTTAMVDLPRLHADPFDRLIVAQALCGPMRLLTGDRFLLSYSELVMLAA